MKTRLACGALGCVLATLAACAADPATAHFDGCATPPDAAAPPPDAAGPPPDAAAPPPDVAPCVDRCAEGASRCAGTGYQACGLFADARCRDWGPVTTCPADQKCADGSCRPMCASVCALGGYRCTPDGSGRAACVEGPDGCRTWGPALACPGTQSCTGAVCADTCVDECTPGARQCSGDGFQACTRGAGGCARWGAPTPCAATETCSNGACAATCTHECVAGAVECAGRTGRRPCGDFDADPCLEWGPVTPCPASAICSSGQCAAACADECAAVGDRRCTSAGTGYRVCGDQADGCLAWGLLAACPPGEACSGGQCVATCACDLHRGRCEPRAPGSTAACACDPDCAGGGAPCGADGRCDPWCPAGHDPDCACACQYNEYCEAAAPSSTATCACDPDCAPHAAACMDDGHCDTFCPAGVDPDCGVDACRERWMSLGWRWGTELALGGAYAAPDPTESDAGWALLSPAGWAGGGAGEILVELAAEHVACVRSLELDVYGYDDSVFGDGAEMYLWNWDTGRYDLLPSTLDRTPGLYDNVVADPAPYFLCGSGAHAKCVVDAKLGTSTWDNSHVRWVELWVFMGR